MEHITRRRAAKVRPYRTRSPSSRQHQLLYVYVILKAAPLRAFQVSTVCQAQVVNFCRDQIVLVAEASTSFIIFIRNSISSVCRAPEPIPVLRFPPVAP
jgi:hypothetical protein